MIIIIDKNIVILNNFSRTISFTVTIVETISTIAIAISIIVETISTIAESIIIIVYIYLWLKFHCSW